MSALRVVCVGNGFNKLQTARNRWAVCSLLRETLFFNTDQVMATFARLTHLTELSFN
jgi:hypothetical protein